MVDRTVWRAALALALAAFLAGAAPTEARGPSGGPPGPAEGRKPNAPSHRVLVASYSITPTGPHAWSLQSGEAVAGAGRWPAPARPVPPTEPALIVPPLEEAFRRALYDPVGPPASAGPMAAFPPLFDAGRGGAAVSPLGAAAEALAPPGGDLSLRLKPAPLEPADHRFPINLATALRLSDARPLIVAAAQASVWVAEARLTRAKVLWVPTLMFGADYIRHDGGLPDFNKGVMTAPSVNFFYAGASAIQNVATTDVFFEPLVARRMLNSRQWSIQTAKNDALQQTADAYFQVHQYRGMYAGALYCVERGRDLVNRIAHLSREFVPAVEVDRARNMLADLEQQSVAARASWRVHSADLTRVLRLDPRAVVVPLESDHLQVTLIDPALSLPDLQRTAMANRPELAERRALVQAAETRIRREKWRPFLPIVQINGFQSAGMLLQAGIFGLGPNSSLNQWTGRLDASCQLVWQFEAFGIGNLARVKKQRGEESRTIVQLYKMQDQIAAEVTQAQARLQSASLRVEQADRALRTAIITFNGNFEGLRHTTRFGDVLVLVYRPQEAVYSLELMKVAFDEYFTTVAEYNRAQFELFHALGYPAREVALAQPAGQAQPVDTSRPAYLPPVGQGPPPATR